MGINLPLHIDTQKIEFPPPNFRQADNFDIHGLPYDFRHFDKNVHGIAG